MIQFQRKINGSEEIVEMWVVKNFEDRSSERKELFEKEKNAIFLYLLIF